MVGGRRAQEDCPEGEIVAPLVAREPGLQLSEAHIEQPAGLVGALHELAEPEKWPGFVAVEGAFGGAELRIAAALDRIAGSRQPHLGEVARPECAEPVMEVIQLIPHVDGQHRPQRPRIFPRRPDRRLDRSRIIRMRHIEADHVVRACFLEGVRKNLFIRVKRHDPSPRIVVAPPLKRGLRFKDARKALGALEIAGHPEDAFGVAGKEAVHLISNPAERFPCVIPETRQALSGIVTNTAAFQDPVSAQQHFMLRRARDDTNRG